MTLQEFINKNNGQLVEVAGSENAKNQCVDLVNAYIRDVLGLPIIEWTHAKDFLEKAGDKYNAFLNTSWAVPLPGDIAVWNSKVGGGYGHIGIITEADVNGFKSFDQNWGKNTACEIETHDYTNVLGWLRIKPSPIAAPEDNPIEKWLKGFFHEKGLAERFNDYKSLIASWWDQSNKFEDQLKAINGWENFRQDLQETLGDTSRDFNDILVRAAALKRKEKEYNDLKKYMEDMKDKVCISQAEYDRLTEKKILDRFNIPELITEILNRLLRKK